MSGLVRGEPFETGSAPEPPLLNVSEQLHAAGRQDLPQVFGIRLFDRNVISSWGVPRSNPSATLLEMESPERWTWLAMSPLKRNARSSVRVNNSSTTTETAQAGEIPAKTARCRKGTLFSPGAVYNTIQDWNSGEA
jgi:hypothetical protein